MFHVSLLESRSLDSIHHAGAGVVALDQAELDLVMGGTSQHTYATAAAYWSAVAAIGGLAGQPEIVFAAGMMAAYDSYMAS